MTLLEKLEQAAQWISDLFAKIPVHIKDYAATAISITDKVKFALESNTVIIITEIIPGDWDDNLRTEAITLLTFLQEALRAIDAIKTSEGSIAQNAIYAKMGAQLIALQDSKVLPEHIYDNYFQNIFSKTQK